MDAATIDVQVLSLSSPGMEQVDGAEAVALAREANERLADAVRNHPTRFGGFASLPTAAPDAAVAELERAIRDYNFKGAMINGHIQGRYLDPQFFWPRLDTMNASVTKLNRPISAYLRENVYYTFSGFNYTPTFLNLLLEVGIDRIMFSADYPFQSMRQARAFLDQLPVSTADRSDQNRCLADVNTRIETCSNALNGTILEPKSVRGEGSQSGGRSIRRSYLQLETLCKRRTATSNAMEQFRLVISIKAMCHFANYLTSLHRMEKN